MAGGTEGVSSLGRRSWAAAAGGRSWAVAAGERLPPPRTTLGRRACCSVCRAWRDVVDTLRLLRADMLPLELRGVFFTFVSHDYPDFVARPSTGPTLSAWADCMPHMDLWLDVEDHCNGLLLSEEMVVNPATGWWAPLPCDTVSLSSDKYHVIRAPIVLSKYQDLHLGKSSKGVYFATLDKQCCLQVWRLKDVSAQM
ncbi:hypothetical protein EJB05_05251, partial [Eragrostis curvula]